MICVACGTSFADDDPAAPWRHGVKCSACAVAPRRTKKKAKSPPLIPLKEQAFAEQMGLCCFCQGKMTISGIRYPYSATWEHVVPASLGGGKGKNLKLSCRECNNRRGVMDYWEFMTLPRDEDNRPVVPKKRQRASTPVNPPVRKMPPPPQRMNEPGLDDNQ